MGYSFSVSLTAVDVLFEHLKLGRTPTPFEVPHIGTTFEQRAQVREAVFRDLEGRRLINRGRLDADAELALRTFADSPVAVTAVAQLDDGRPLFARVASNGQYAVVVRQDENMLVFNDVRPTSIVPSIVDLLPSTPPAAGQSVTVSKPAPRSRQPRGDDSYDPFATVSRPRSTAPAQLRMVERIFQKPKLRIGQFSVFVGGRPLTPTVWFDTPDGRYFVTSREAEDGQSWLTYAPADNARITQHLFGQLQSYAR
ncbi:MAG TPA: ESX secretion-associated protein EspG [Amycolatopsis sp.]|uniref:ESX secretion-associated protein EspG n=1 Tax=Amycolatopsis sp. TaxID=37632 RepID=UPI002B4957A4|nr:ESX secretion-associated protein EspG [Amycolatopsis sp.]HKS48158.1 ESX secretion-associated protein EspG [Amycolatopsis sp.]